MARIEYSLKATHAQTRAHNASLVLRALYDLGPISPRGHRPPHRPDPHQRRRAGRGPRGRGPGPRGRPRPEHRRQGTRPSSRSRATPAPSIVLDLGERTFTAALANLRGELTNRAHPRPRRPRRRRRPRPRPRADRRGQPRGDQPDPRHRRRHPGHRRRATARSAGRSTSTGRTCRSPTSSRDRYGLPTIVANDAARRGPRHVPLRGRGPADQPRSRIKVGRGIGAGLVLDGDLFGGDGDGAGEIGHIVVEPDGAECHCGRFGCLETVASAPAILRAAVAAGLPASDHAPRAGRRRPARRRGRPGRHARRGPGARRRRSRT